MLRNVSINQRQEPIGTVIDPINIYIISPLLPRNNSVGTPAQGGLKEPALLACRQASAPARRVSILCAVHCDPGCESPSMTCRDARPVTQKATPLIVYAHCAIFKCVNYVRFPSNPGVVTDHQNARRLR